MRALPMAALVAVLVNCSQTPTPSADKAADSQEKPTTYLASINVPLEPNERLDSFSIDTWGVEFLAVCHFPSGWRITAGSSATPDGIIAGEGSHGATWLGDVKPLKSLVLLRLYAPAQRVNDGIAAPATFKGKAHIQTPDTERAVELTYESVELVRADRCPLHPEM